ncbi:hypothetical protein F4861DRAFT_540846 [Xylaria intraflava]|nr:hypothetical protein F4861DRAFT_540846 [Xylaria intraflava]
MAQDDTAPHGPPGATEPPDHGSQSPIYESFNGSTTPGGTQPAGAPSSGIEGPPQKPKRPTFTDGVQSIKSDDFFRVHQMPCARDGFMTGIGAGTVVGAVRYIAGARVPKAANWACGAFLLGSIIQYEYCQAQRRKELAAVARAVQIMDRREAEKKARATEVMRLRQEAEEKARQDQKSWYKFW